MAPSEGRFRKQNPIALFASQTLGDPIIFRTPGTSEIRRGPERRARLKRLGESPAGGKRPFDAEGNEKPSIRPPATLRRLQGCGVGIGGRGSPLAVQTVSASWSAAAPDAPRATRRNAFLLSWPSKPDLFHGRGGRFREKGVGIRRFLFRARASGGWGGAPVRMPFRPFPAENPAADSSRKAVFDVPDFPGRHTGKPSPLVKVATALSGWKHLLPLQRFSRDRSVSPKKTTLCRQKYVSRRSLAR